MKNFLLFLLLISAAACNNTNTSANNTTTTDNEPQLQCNALSDALLMGYKGHIKKVIERRHFANDTNGALIVDNEAYFTHVFEFDSTGQATRHTLITNGGRDMENVETYEHNNGTIAAMYSLSINKDPNLKDDITKRNWLNEHTYCDVRSMLYRNPYNGKDTTLKGDSIVFTLDKQCRKIEKKWLENNTSIQNTKTQTYKYSGDSIYTYSLKADGSKELKDIGLIKERDSIGNTTKVLYPGHDSNVYTYTYEYY